MTSLRQIAANRLNARKSTGPVSAHGKQRSRQNAVRHGLTAETVITALENPDDFRTLEASLVADYRPQSATERELVLRLASVLWRLRRASCIETGLFQVEAELMQQRNAEMGRNPVPPPQWTDEPDAVAVSHASAIASRNADPTIQVPGDGGKALADCFLKVSRLGDGAFYLLSRYESALWRQAAQLLFILGSPPRRMRQRTGTKLPTAQASALHSEQRSVVRLVALTKRRPE